MEGKILWALSEAHEENIAALANTVASRGEEVRQELRHAINRLLDLGLVEAGEYDGHPPKFLALDRRILSRAFDDGGPLEWNQEDDVWLWHPSLLNREVELTIVLTDRGVQVLES